jgi:uncharacterized protein (DUF2267 family)
MPPEKKENQGIDEKAMTIKMFAQALSALDPDRLTKQEIEEFLKLIVEKVKGMETNTQTTLETVLKAVNSAISRIESSSTDNHAKVREELTVGQKQAMEMMMKAHEEKMRQADEKMDSLRDGMDADQEEMTQAVIEALAPTLKVEVTNDIESKLPQLGTAVRDGLELLKDDERLDASAIKGLDERLKELREAISSRPVGGLISSRYIPQTILTTASTIDAQNLAFVFDKKPQIIYVNGAGYRENKGWSWSAKTATLDNPVGTGGDIYGVL